MNKIMEKYEKLLNMLMDFQPLVRFCAIFSKTGEIKWHSQRDGVENIIAMVDTKNSILRASKAWDARKELSLAGTGKGMYTITAYEKIKRITIPLDEDNILFISTNNEPKKSKDYGRLVGMGEILSIIEFINKN
jgi:ribonucleotide monophosphatase NagD (HAD superfamily)